MQKNDDFGNEVLVACVQEDPAEDLADELYARPFREDTVQSHWVEQPAKAVVRWTGRPDEVIDIVTQRRVWDD